MGMPEPQQTDPSIRPIWILHLGALGDWILTWPALLCLRRAYPRHRFLGIGRPDYMNLAVRFGILDSFADGESRGMIGLFSGDGLPADLDPPDGAVVWMREAEPLCDLLKSFASLPVLSLDPIPGQAEIHVARAHCEAIGREFSIRIPDDLTEGFPGHEPKSHHVLIHPGSGSESKNFGGDFYENIAYFLRENGHSKIAFLIGPVEMDRRRPEAFKNQNLIFPKDTGALADWLQNAVLYIGNDSGVSHLAGFMGIPSVVVYRSTDPSVWGVLGRSVHPVVAGGEDSAFEKVVQKITAIRLQDAAVPPSGGL
jgi:heptosyltransferase-3